MKYNRMYSGTDAFMAESARTTLGHLQDDLAEFTAYSSRFDAPYVAGFEAAVDAADNVITDDAMAAQQMTKTTGVLDSMEQARRVYRRAKSYAELAFADSPARVNEFTRGYSDARQNQAKMIVFLDSLENAINQHSADLTNPAGGGMPATFTAQVTAARSALQSQNLDQELFIDQRSTTAEDRIKILNACYRKMTEVNNAAQIVFEDSPARRQVYTYRPSSNPAEAEVYSGVVAKERVAVVATVPYKSLQLISFENTGTVALLFDLVAEADAHDAASLKGNLIDLAGGAVVTQSMGWLNDTLAEDAMVKIVVHNPGTTEDGRYMVSVNLE